MRAIEIIRAHGHHNILSTHETTFEITKETELTKRGNCIIAVGAEKGAINLGTHFKQVIRKRNSYLTITIETGGIRDVVNANGSNLLLLNHPSDLVIRKSDYVCGRTLAIGANKAAKDLSRKLTRKSQDPNQEILIILVAEVIN